MCHLCPCAADLGENPISHIYNISIIQMKSSSLKQTQNRHKAASQLHYRQKGPFSGGSYAK